jgi:CubicO group peptidase (beta-lactamase class C family)
MRDAPISSLVQGRWTPRFARLSKEFGKQLGKGRSGAALCVMQHGEPVLDVFGGARDAKGAPWQENTLVMGFSSGKGCAATLMHALVDRELAHYDDPVAKHWPEFARAGKEAITIRHVLSHGAGLYRLSDMVSDFWQILDFERMVKRVEDARPAHAPGDGSGYHGISFSWTLGELLRRVGKKPVAELLREHLVQPLALDGAYFGLPEHEFERCAELLWDYEPMTLGYHALGVVHPLARALSLGRLGTDNLRSALVVPARGGVSWNDRRLRSACLLSSTGVFTARSLASIYAPLANGGKHAGRPFLSSRTLEALQQVQSTGRDRVTGVPSMWRLGYHGIQTEKGFVPDALGHCGYRGTGAFADPRRGLSFAFLHNAKGSSHPMGGDRFQRLAQLALDCADA